MVTPASVFGPIPVVQAKPYTHNEAQMSLFKKFNLISIIYRFLSHFGIPLASIKDSRKGGDHFAEKNIFHYPDIAL
ncbi:MAG: hypothetical protein PVG17_08130, partial [Desulfobacterales bacterium]